MKKSYEVVIIGAGVGGLTCGCYLAKSGLKVLIVEQHDKPGGYCTSFFRKGYRFDVGVRYLGGVNNGILGNILEELDLKNELDLFQFDPTDKILFPEHEIYIYADPQKTIDSLKDKFPKEKDKIDKFFKFIRDKNFFNVYLKIKKMTYGELMDSFFSDKKLKFVLNSIVYANTGVMPHEIGALYPILLFRVYLLDPGYYPKKGGIQSVPNAFERKFEELGGEIVFFSKVKKIQKRKDGNFEVIMANNDFVISERIVSNSGLKKFFGEILESSSKEMNRLNFKTSPSAFIEFLGVNMNIKEKFNVDAGILYFSDYEFSSLPVYDDKNLFSDELSGILCEFTSLHDKSFTSKKTALSFTVLVPYKTKEFWNGYKKEFSEKLLRQMEEKVLKFKIDESIEVKSISTPQVLEKYTSNCYGAAFGLLSSMDQIKSSVFPSKTSVENVYITGHWTTLGFGQGGVSGVALSGRKTAEILLREKKINWEYPLLKP